MLFIQKWSSIVSCYIVHLLLYFFSHKLNVTMPVHCKNSYSRGYHVPAIILIHPLHELIPLSFKVFSNTRTGQITHLFGVLKNMCIDILAK